MNSPSCTKGHGTPHCPEQWSPACRKAFSSFAAGLRSQRSPFICKAKVSRLLWLPIKTLANTEASIGAYICHQQCVKQRTFRHLHISSPQRCAGCIAKAQEVVQDLGGAEHTVVALALPRCMRSLPGMQVDRGATANRYEVENKRCGSEGCVLLGPAAHDGLPHQLIIDALH
jgi:hypothetical protein